MRKLLVALFLAQGIYVATALADTEKQNLIRLAHSNAETSPVGESAEYFADLVNERLKDEIRVEVHANSELYEESVGVNKVKTEPGLIVVASVTDLSDLAPALNLFESYGLFRNIQDVNKVVNSPLAEDVVHELKAHGLLPLAFWNDGMTMLYTTPFSHANKSGDEPGNQASAESLQRKTSNSPYPGEFDGIGSWTEIHALTRSGSPRTVIEPVLGYNGKIVLVNREYWNSLPDLTRRQIRWAMGEATLNQRILARKLEQKIRDDLVKSGAVKVMTINDEQLKTGFRLLKGVDLESGGSDKPVDPNLVNEVRELLKD